MDRILNNKRMAEVYSRLQRFNEQRVLYAIRNAFVAIMPVMIIGAFATVFTSLPISGYQAFMQTYFGPGWKLFGELIFAGTTQISTLSLVMAICINLAAWHNRQRVIHVREGIAAMIGLACYVMLSLPAGILSGMPVGITGVNGMFVGMVVAVCATEIFIAISARGRAYFLNTDDPDFAVSQSLSAVFPAAATMLLFLAVRLVLVAMGLKEGLPDLVNSLLFLPLQHISDTQLFAALFNFATHLMWLFGIHGTNVLDTPAKDIFAAADAQNMAAVAAGGTPANLVTKTTLDAFVSMGGAGATLALLLALVLFGRTRSYRGLYAYALPTALFNINEPLMYGIPIVLNPVFAIPFLLAPVVLLGTTAAAMGLGLVPYVVAKVEWSTPVFISGYLATQSIAGAVLQLFNLMLATLIYAPFVKLSERLNAMRFADSYKSLTDYIIHEYDPSQRLMARVDEIGAVARKIGAGVEHAIYDGSMYLVYQPIVDARTNTLHSVEALLRWNSKQHGFINPMVAVALAEEVGRMDELGLWILDKAIAQRAAWNEEGLGDFHVSVNVSTSQLEDPRFHRRVEKILEQYAVPPRQLQIEITETAALVDNKATHDNLELLARMGVTLAMDDFGVGHSSLLYLRTQPITTLKIDASLSTDIVENPHSLNIVLTIRDLCKLLGVDTIVEHVDNQTQLDLLLEVDAYLIQGYLFSQPLPGAELPAYLKKLHSQRRFPAHRKS